MLVLTTGKGEALGQDLILEKRWRWAQLFRVLLISMVGKCQKQFSESQVPAARLPDLPYVFPQIPPSPTPLPRASRCKSPSAAMDSVEAASALPQGNLSVTEAEAGLGRSLPSAAHLLSCPLVQWREGK